MLLLASLAVWVCAVAHGFVWCALGMLMMTVAMRTVMTTGAVALMGALPESHTSMGSAMNDTAQEVGNAVGLAIVGTVMASVVGTALPTGAWDPATVAGFIHSQQISFSLLAVLVLVLAGVGIRTLTDSRDTAEH
ncbi:MULTISPECIES: hypothetical protein [Kocuria]|uniref:hypothetical protein n=1 Tax=Kocuria TaxID=57493 RepID=UPI000DD468C9|nr:MULTISPECIES: hypothetical protein [Kocuria]MBK4121581.1 hypothetical protein [Kocuria rhizophila]MCC5671637.1 hypothetical protein [Kocuria rhizophila]